MFRLKIDAATREITIQQRKDAPLFTPQFITALTIAFLLHFTFFLLFPISNTYLNYPTTTLPPIAVESLKDKESFTETERNRTPKEISYLLPESPVTFAPISPPRKKGALLAQNRENNDPIGMLEAEFYFKKIFTDHPTVTRHTPQIHLSGAIGKLILDKEALLETYREISLPYDQLLMKKYNYEVLVDCNNGKILWFERIKGTPHSTEMEKLLLSLLFKTSNPVILRGEIEIITTSKRGKK